jgi:hypothetical protein
MVEKGERESSLTSAKKEYKKKYQVRRRKEYLFLSDKN